MKRHVLDASALYRFLMDQPGADIVEELFRQSRDAGTTLLVSVVNWGEVYYNVARKSGFVAAQAFMAQVKLLPITVLDADEAITESAARCKAGYGLPYADCFAAAIAGKTNVLVTSDVKDFKKIPWLQLRPLPQYKP
jgi:predicted nucleic acid-binding protein